MLVLLRFFFLEDALGDFVVPFAFFLEGVLFLLRLGDLEVREEVSEVVCVDTLVRLEDWEIGDAFLGVTGSSS